MEIIARKGESFLFVRHKGEEIEWRFGVWATLARKIGDETSEEMTEEQFQATNEYMASLPQNVQDKMWANYKEAHQILSEFVTKEEAQKIFMKYSSAIVEDLDEGHLMAWAKEHGKIHIEPSPLLRSSNPHKHMTYTDQESFELCAFCVAVKILAPIMGSYVELVREKSSRDKSATLHKEMNANELFLRTKLADWNVYKRLELYLGVYASRREKILKSLAVRYDIPVSRLPALLKGLTVIRRLMLATVRSGKNGTIIAFIYMFLDEKISGLAKDVSFKSKFNSRKSDDQEDEAYTDNFRRPEDIDQGTVVSIDDDLSNWIRYAQKLGLNEQECKTADCILETLIDDPLFHVTDAIHYPVIAMLICNDTYHMAIDKVEYRTLMGMIAVAAVYCNKMGWSDLAELLLAYRQEVDPTQMQLNSRNGVSYKRLTTELEQKLSDVYQYLDQAMISKPTNQGKIWIETVIEIVLSYRWSGLTEPSYLRHSMANFIIRRPYVLRQEAKQAQVVQAEVTQ